MSDAEKTYLFKYWMNLTVVIEGQRYDLGRELDSDVQFRPGDVIAFIDYIDTEDEDCCTVKRVRWDVDVPGFALLDMEDIELDGPLSDWTDLFDFMREE